MDHLQSAAWTCPLPAAHTQDWSVEMPSSHQNCFHWPQEEKKKRKCWWLENSRRLPRHLQQTFCFPELCAKINWQTTNKNKNITLTTFYCVQHVFCLFVFLTLLKRNPESAPPTNVTWNLFILAEGELRCQVSSEVTVFGRQRYAMTCCLRRNYVIMPDCGRWDKSMLKREAPETNPH